MSLFTKEIRGGVLHLRFGRKAGINLIQAEWFAELTAAMAEAAIDPAVRCIYLAANGKSFSNGADLQLLRGDPFPDGIMNSSLAGLLTLLETYEKPLVAAVHGSVVGGGVTILLHCDFAYADESAVFQLPFTKLGIVPELGSSYLLKYFAGRRLANELILLSKSFDAATALHAGIINEIVPRAGLEAKALETAAALAALPPAGLRATKRILRQAEYEVYAKAWREECLLLESCTQGEELQEATAAFLERRQPDFSRFN